MAALKDHETGQHKRHGRHGWSPLEVEIRSLVEVFKDFFQQQHWHNVNILVGGLEHEFYFSIYWE